MEIELTKKNAKILTKWLENFENDFDDDMDDCVNYAVSEFIDNEGIQQDLENMTEDD